MYAVYLIVTGKKLGRIRWAEYVFHIDRKKNAPKQERANVTGQENLGVLSVDKGDLAET